MKKESQTKLDVAVIGGGPAGITACLEFSKSPHLDVALFESEAELGGIPRTCHLRFFGFRDQKRIYTGAAYAQTLIRKLRRTPIRIFTDATVIKLIVGDSHEPHRIDVSTPEGIRTFQARFIILATGCFEASRSARIIPGNRPSGVITTGTLMELVNLRGQKPGHRALILGSEHVSLSSVLTLKRAGVKVVGMVEEDQEVQTYAPAAKAMKSFYHFPIFKGTSVNAILGHSRVEEVELYARREERFFRVVCDTVVLTGKFRSYAPLIDHTAIKRDPLTFGPVLDADFMTTVPGIFCAGNVMRGANMHDLCALEGKRVARGILDRPASDRWDTADTSIPIQAQYPVRFVVPQKVGPEAMARQFPFWLHPGYSLQMAYTILNPVLEAWSGQERVWKKSFSKMIGHAHIPLPVHKFDWHKVDPSKELIVKLGTDAS
jgi:thioredoxin reductase